MLSRQGVTADERAEDAHSPTLLRNRHFSTGTNALISTITDSFLPLPLDGLGVLPPDCRVRLTSDIR